MRTPSPAAVAALDFRIPARDSPVAGPLSLPHERAAANSLEKAAALIWPFAWARSNRPATNLETGHSLVHGMFDAALKPAESEISSIFDLNPPGRTTAIAFLGCLAATSRGGTLARGCEPAVRWPGIRRIIPNVTAGFGLQVGRNRTIPCGSGLAPPGVHRRPKVESLLATETPRQGRAWFPGACCSNASEESAKRRIRHLRELMTRRESCLIGTLPDQDSTVVVLASCPLPVRPGIYRPCRTRLLQSYRHCGGNSLDAC
jgi:hypothetical protein